MSDNPLYLSGLLKKKMLKNYLFYLTSYNGNSLNFTTPKLNFNFNYDGKVTFAEENATCQKQWQALQELRIKQGIDEIHTWIKYQYGRKKWNLNGQMVKILDEVNNIINIILQDPDRKYTFALLNCLYNIIRHSNITTLKDNLNNFLSLILYLHQNSYYLNQIAIDLIIKQFCKDKYFIAKSYQYILPTLKIKTFHLDEDELDQATRNTLLLGEFVAPQKVPVMAPILQNQDALAILIATVYFLITDKQIANNFLIFLKQNHPDQEQIRNYLTEKNISPAINTLLRQK